MKVDEDHQPIFVDVNISHVFLVVSQLLIGPQFNPMLSFEMQARSLHLRTQNRKLSKSEVATIWGSEPPIWNWPVTCGCGWFLRDWKWHLTLAETVCFDGFRTSCVGLIVLQLPASVHWHLWDWPCHECDMNSAAKADGKITPLQWYSENKAPNRKKLFTLQETWLYVCCLLFKKKMCSWRFLKIFPNQATKTPKHVCRAEMSSEALAPWSCRGIESLTSTNHISLAPKKANPGVTCVKSLDTSNQTWWSNRFLYREVLWWVCDTIRTLQLLTIATRKKTRATQNNKCLYIYTYTYTHTYTYTYTYIYIYVLFMCIYLSIYLSIYLFIYLYNIYI